MIVNRGAGYGLEIPCILYHLYGPKPYIDEMKELVDSVNSIWTCIGPTSRLNLKKLLDNNVLFTVCESLR